MGEIILATVLMELGEAVIQELQRHLGGLLALKEMLVPGIMAVVVPLIVGLLLGKYALGGMLAWGVYLVIDLWLGMPFLSCLAASVFAVVYAEIMARVRKIPALLLTVPAIIPLVPGRTLYYAMREAVHGDLAQARAYGIETLLAALAIAGGISFAIVFRELQTKR